MPARSRAAAKRADSARDAPLPASSTDFTKSVVPSATTSSVTTYATLRSIDAGMGTPAAPPARLPRPPRSRIVIVVPLWSSSVSGQALGGAAELDERLELAEQALGRRGVGRGHDDARR